MIADKKPKGITKEEEQADLQKTVENHGQTVQNNGDGSATVMLTPYQAMLKDQWEQTHPGQALPIYLNKDSQPVWANRRQRLAAQAMDRKKLKKILRTANTQKD